MQNNLPGLLMVCLGLSHAAKKIGDQKSNSGFILIFVKNTSLIIIILSDFPNLDKTKKIRKS